MGSCVKNISVLEIFITVIIGLSALALILYEERIARPGIWGLSFEETNCTVNKTVDRFRNCTCSSSGNSDHCSSVTPCVEVEVAFNFETKNETKSVTTIIYNDESTGIGGGDCSVSYCQRDSKRNYNFVKNKFLPKYGKKGATYKCYYNPENYKQVIINRKFSMTAIVLSLTVPVVALLLSTLALYIVCKYKIGKKCCRLKRISGVSIIGDDD